jgi:hypothetical protein
LKGFAMPKQSGHWVPAIIEDEEITYSFEAHKPRKLSKSIPWLCCANCGLLYLNNPITKWCIKMGCNHSYHNQFKFILKKITKGRT